MSGATPAQQIDYGRLIDVDTIVTDAETSSRCGWPNSYRIGGGGGGVPGEMVQRLEQ